MGANMSHWKYAIARGNNIDKLQVAAIPPDVAMCASTDVAMGVTLIAMQGLLSMKVIIRDAQMGGARHHPR